MGHRVHPTGGAPVDRWIAALCMLSLWLAIAAPVVAQGEVTPGSEHTYVFGQTATFVMRSPLAQEVSEEADALTERGIDQATLYLRADASHTETYPAVLEDDGATLTRDLQAMPLPPFAFVTYWWVYERAGESFETEKRTFQYTDNRYEWKTASQDSIRIHWVDGERDRMVQALDVAQDALSRLQGALQSPSGAATDIYIYPSHPDLAAAMQLAGRSWAGAIAYPDLSVILVAIPPTAEGLLTMDRDIPHELTHKAVYDLLGEQGYASLPTWLNEGLAVHFEARPEPSYAVALETAHESGSLIPLSELCAPFPEEPQLARLAYAESGSLVNYLRQHYGWSRIRELMQAYADGMACNTGVQEALGTDLTHLERSWRVWLEGEQQSGATPETWAGMSMLVRDAGPWLLLLGLLLLPVLLLVVGGEG
ncbi:MAG: peptidase MA family metallohydrolase [Anaerolineae bacterium]